MRCHVLYHSGLRVDIRQFHLEAVWLLKFSKRVLSDFWRPPSKMVATGWFRGHLMGEWIIRDYWIWDAQILCIKHQLITFSYIPISFYYSDVQTTFKGLSGCTLMTWVKHLLCISYSLWPAVVWPRHSQAIDCQVTNTCYSLYSDHQVMMMIPIINDCRTFSLFFVVHSVTWS